MMKTFKQFSIGLLALLCCYSCQKKILDNNTQLYTNEAGQHASRPLSLTDIKGVKQFKVRFRIVKGSYEIRDENGNLHPCQNCWNKLTGFSDCNNFDAKAGLGAMLGWRWNQEKKYIEFAAYVHNKKAPFKAKTFQLVSEEGVWHELTIEVGDYTYLYTLDDESILMDGEYGRGCGNLPIVGRMVRPYFGGTQPAPEKIQIEIQYL